jgi:hypothetical protein
VHTGEVQLRDDANYAGPTINRTARLRDLAHGGQTVVSGATEAMVIDRLPDDAWLNDLGTHQLRDLPRPERVVQLCHPDLRNDFPPLRTSTSAVSHNFPAPLTSFVGRQAEMTKLRQIVAANRLITLTGAGGAGKTRLAVEVTAELAAEFPDGVWYIDLSPPIHPWYRSPSRAPSDCPISRVARQWTYSYVSSAAAECCYCSTIASTCWTPAERWLWSCSMAARN